MSPRARSALVRRAPSVLRPDPSRVVTKLFLPGQELAASARSRSSVILDRALALGEDDVHDALAAVTASFANRHSDLEATLLERYGLVAHRLADPGALSPERRMLIGAYFSMEYAIEAAALFNPSMVEHPDQSGVDPGSLRFLMSVRAVGEGHHSSVEFRTGVVDAQGTVAFDRPGPVVATAREVPTVYARSVFERQHAQLGGDPSAVDFVLGSLPERFSRAELDAALGRLREQRLTRGSAARATDRLEWIAACNYTVAFPADTSLDARALLPRSPAEHLGIEDVRLARFTESDGSVDYRGTYTAYDGSRIAPHGLQTTDFRTFALSQLSGPAAQNKGMALFPRRVGGAYLALSRWDRESNTLARSDDSSHWEVEGPLQAPERPWEIVQIGNCGPPIETDAGWLVLTHGVGPMREYAIGALLLDLDDPLRVLGRLPQPLLRASAQEREGYVPNVVYSCGAMRHGDLLVLPYGCSDATIRVALVDLPGLLESLTHGSVAPG